MSTNITIFAAEVKEVSKNEYSDKELNKIETERQALYDDIKMQLLAQDSLDKFEIFKFIADDEINAKYYPQFHSSRISYYAPKGGNISSKDGILQSVAEFMTAENANTLYQKANETDLTSFISALVLLRVGIKWTAPGAYISAADIFNSFTNYLLWINIDKGKDNAIIYSVYDDLDSKTTTVVHVWSDYPYMSDSYSLGKNITHQTY